jgi:hypothetical protein
MIRDGDQERREARRYVLRAEWPYDISKFAP